MNSSLQELSQAQLAQNLHEFQIQDKVDIQTGLKKIDSEK